MTIKVVPLTGAAVGGVLADLARLRITVFRDWPYLYDGTDDYERAYLANFAASEGAVVVVARDGPAIVGAATAAPMRAGHAEELVQPLAASGHDISRIFYLGESVLLKGYRGRGLGHAFFEQREAHALSLGGFTDAVFCGVVRSDTDARKPTGYVPLDAFWRKRGYAPLPNLTGSLSWLDIGETSETAKPMRYWMKAL